MVNDPRDDHGAALLMIANQNREIADLRAEREMVVASWKREELDWEATEKALRARVAELEAGQDEAKGFIEGLDVENNALRARVSDLEAMNKMLCGKLDDQRRA